MIFLTGAAATAHRAAVTAGMTGAMTAETDVMTAGPGIDIDGAAAQSAAVPVLCHPPL